MKKWVLPFTIACIFFCSPVSADDTQVAPEGMEYIQVSSGYKILVPKGTKMTQIGNGSYKPEDINVYIGRRFAEEDEKIRMLQDENRELRGMIGELRTQIEELKSKAK